MSVGFFGIQFGFALQNANVSRIFETLGAEIDKIGFFMDRSTHYRFAGTTDHWLFKRQNLASEMGQEKAIFLYWRFIFSNCFVFNATVKCIVDGRNFAVGAGCFY